MTRRRFFASPRMTRKTTPRPMGERLSQKGSLFCFKKEELIN
jgi:hypothetical protein